MLMEMYLTLAVIGFAVFVTAILIGSYAREKKIGSTLTLLLICTIIFSVLAINSLSVTKQTCKNQVTQTELDADTNITTYTNQISCNNQRNPDQALGYLFAGLAALTIVLGFVYFFQGETQ